MNSISVANQNLLRVPNREMFLRDMKDIFRSEKDRKKIAVAYDFAAQTHATDIRRSGERYMCHIEDAVRRYVSIRRERNMPISVDDIIDIIVHDTVEDHPKCETDFREIFEGNKHMLGISPGAFERQKLLSKPHIEEPFSIPESPLWYIDIGRYSGANNNIRELIVEAPTLFSDLWKGYATFYEGGKLSQEFFYACQILGYDEHTFEKKCADQLSNLYDMYEVIPQTPDTLEILNEKKKRNISAIYIAENVYKVKARILGREDLTKLFTEGIKKRRAIQIKIQEAITQKESHDALSSDESSSGPSDPQRSS